MKAINLAIAWIPYGILILLIGLALSTHPPVEPAPPQKWQPLTPAQQLCLDIYKYSNQPTTPTDCVNITPQPEP